MLNINLPSARHSYSKLLDAKTNNNFPQIFSLFLVLLFNPIICFSQGACGSLSNSYSPLPGTNPALRIYDRFGNEYSQESIQVPRVERGREGSGGCEDCNAPTMDIGIYRLYFMDIINHTGHGFDETSPFCTNRKRVLCQVFNDLNNFLTTTAGVPRVNVRIRESGILSPSGTSNLLAAASSFYMLMSGTLEGIIDGETWKTVNGDEDSYLGYPPAFLQQFGAAVPGNAGYFHGDIHFFFPQDAEFYHTDFTTVPPANKIDMYTVTLHEVMHMLGFASLIGEDGQSKLGSCPECYSRYDSYLELKTNGQPVIAQNSNSGDACLEITYDGPNSMATGCTNGVVFDGANNPNQDVFSPSGWASSSSLSHFDCADDLLTCPFQNSENVMTWCNQGGPDFTRRHPSQAEANTFCDLAYHRKNTWGDSGNATIFKSYDDCSDVPCFVNPVAYNDWSNSGGPFTISTDLPVGPFGYNLLVTLNDVNVSGISCATIESGGGSIEIINSGSQSSIIYSLPATPVGGYIIIRYRAYKNCGNEQIESNDAYVFIFVDSPPVCPENSCNLICGGDFESTTFCLTYAGFLIDGNQNTPDLYRRSPVDGMMHVLFTFGGFWMSSHFLLFGCSSEVPIPDPHSSPNDAYIAFAAAPGGGEGIMFPLNQPMHPGNQYTLSFWARGTEANCNPTISVWGDDVAPCTPPDATTLDGTASPCGFTAESFSATTVSDQWQQYTVQINPSQEINFIVISSVGLVTVNNYTLIDDIVLLHDPNPTALSILATVDNNSPCTSGISTITYNIQLSGTDPKNPNPVNLQALIPAGFSVISPSDFSVLGEYTIPANTLLPGVPYPLTLTLQLDPGVILSGTLYKIVLNITENACYSGSLANNTVIITPKDALLSISTTVSDPFVAWGDALTIYVEVCNLTNQPLNGIVVTDILPPDLPLSNPIDFTLNGSTLESQPFDLPGNDPGLPPNCILLSFEAKYLNTLLCGFIEDCATASYSPCKDVSDCVQISNSTGAEVELANTNNLDPATKPTGETGKIMSIMGTFTILSGTIYTLDACKVLMQPDAEIILEPNATLQIINGTDLHACDDLWKSITVNNGASLFINTGSIVQDARRAIDIPATTATLSLNGCTFRNNYIGIYAHYGNNTLINGMIRNSIFECPNPVFEYNNQTYAGIYLNRAIIPNIRNCSFSDMNFGIYANASPLQVSFCHFENIQPYYTVGFSGTGITSITKGAVDLIVHGDYGSDPAFEDCNRGIYSFNTNLQVSSLGMKDVATGIEFKIVNAPVEYPIVIAQTNIECSDYGIKGLVLSPQQDPMIHSNFMKVTDTNQDGIASGIYVESDIVQSAVAINNNTVHVEDGEFGIFVRNFLGATVVLNGSGNNPDDAIQLNSSNSTGIQIENTHSGYVGCNHVKNGSSMDNTTGMNIVSSPLIEFDCNHMDQTAVGFRVNGVCNTPQNFKGSDFGDHTTGFQIINFGRIGTQTHRGNIWDGIDNLEAQNLGDPAQSPFIVDENVPDFLPSPIFPLNWFATETPTGDSYACNQSSCPLSKPAPAPVIDNVDLLIAGGASSRPTSFSPQGLEWTSTSYLYEKLKAYPDLADQNSVLTDFIYDYASSSAGELFDLHQQTINMALFGFDTLAFLNQVADINSDYSQRLTEIDSLLSLSPFPSIVETLLSEQMTILQSLRKNTWKTEQLQTALNSLIAEKSDDLQVNNEAVVSANIPETNYQTVNSIWLESVGIGKPDLLYDHDTVLYQIAHQCPHEGGWAVYWARGLYSYIGHQDYDDDQLCSSNSQERLNKHPIVLNPKLTIVPNPANDMINLSWTFDHASGGANLIITNALQQTVFDSQTDASGIRIDVKTFQSGVYYAFVIQEGKIVLSKPFIITK